MRALAFFGIILGCCLQSVSPAQADDEARLLNFQDTYNDIRAFSGRIKSAETGQQKTDAIVDLTNLYLRVITDPRFSRSETLQGYRRRIASVLRSEQKRLQRALEKRSEDGQSPSSRYSVAPSGDGDEPLPLFAIVDDHLRLASHASGGAGPTMYFSSGSFGTSGYFSDQRLGGMAGDNSAELINLIENVLHPDFWSINGGVGTLFYYRPSMILVVRATTTVHEDLSRLLNRLR